MRFIFVRKRFQEKLLLKFHNNHLDNKVYFLFYNSKIRKFSRFLHS